jgi:hypothetical protein
MKRHIDEMTVILNELKIQCLKTANLIENLDTKNKSQDEKDEITGELSANLAILTVKSGLIEGYLDDEDYIKKELNNNF